MNTPIVDFVKNYIASDFSRLHMPGHKGKNHLGFESIDITEFQGADVLYSPEGIIAQSEENATVLFGSGHSYYSAEGSSLTIKAMLAIAMMNRKDRFIRPLILAARNVHKTFVYGCALLDIDVKWMYPGTVTSGLCSCNITPEQLENELYSMDIKPFAVYVTSPDYLGNILDIKGLSEVCRKYKLPLLVDNAHGAYLRFMEPSCHPMDLGATMCCDSAHKTLPCVTGGAYLHVAKDAPEEYFSTARSALSMFASTSPSYLILQSLDMCNAYIADGYRTKLVDSINKVQVLKSELRAMNWFVEEGEALKIVVDASRSGISGDTLADHLRSHKIEVEFSDFRHVVMMFTPDTDKKTYHRVKIAFEDMSAYGSTPAVLEKYHLRPAEKLMSIRDAVFAPREYVSSEDAVGRICASPTVSCPPAIPIVVSGEVITDEAVELFELYGITEIEVVK